jgi:hypothetical protein
MRREIIFERNGVYDFLLPIFGAWLQDVGISRLVSDALAEELAEAAQLEEDTSYVRADEVVAVAGNWPPYRGKKIGTDELRAWFEQVQLHKEQRLLFNIAKNVKVFSEIEIRHKLQVAHSVVRRRLPEFVVKNRKDRRSDIVVTYIDGEGKSGQYYAARYAEENRIRLQAVLSPHRFAKSFDAYSAQYGKPATLVIVDDIAATGRSLGRSLLSFVNENEEALKRSGVTVVALVLTGTAQGEEHIREVMQTVDWIDFDLRVMEPLMSDAFAFDPNNKMWDNTNDLERAKALCRDLGANIYQDNPLGYGDQALLVIFPDACPNNTLPILHSSSQLSAPRKWFPLFPRFVQQAR